VCSCWLLAALGTHCSLHRGGFCDIGCCLCWRGRGSTQIHSSLRIGARSLLLLLSLLLLALLPLLLPLLHAELLPLLLPLLHAELLQRRHQRRHQQHGRLLRQHHRWLLLLRSRVLLRLLRLLRLLVHVHLLLRVQHHRLPLLLLMLQVVALLLLLLLLVQREQENIGGCFRILLLLVQLVSCQGQACLC
jgi:hypothetical protein